MDECAVDERAPAALRACLLSCAVPVSERVAPGNSVHISSCACNPTRCRCGDKQHTAMKRYVLSSLPSL